jgi:hypothetical protein
MHNLQLSDAQREALINTLSFNIESLRDGTDLADIPVDEIKLNKELLVALNADPELIASAEYLEQLHQDCLTDRE